MPIVFPSNPTNGSIFQIGNLRYIYNSNSWESISNGFPPVEIIQPLGTLEGLTISTNNSNPNTHLNIGPGRCIVSLGSETAGVFNGSSLIKRIDQSWASGSGNGGRFSGTLSASQTWHIFIMRNDSSGVVDAGFSTSITASDKPSGWSVRRIGSWLLDGSNNLRNIKQDGSYFYHNTQLTDNLGSASAGSFLIACYVPTGLKLLTNLGVLVGTSNAGCPYNITDPDTADISLINNGGLGFWLDQASNGIGSGASSSCYTNTSAQIRLRTAATANRWLTTIGWFDERV